MLTLTLDSLKKGTKFIRSTREVAIAPSNVFIKVAENIAIRLADGTEHSFGKFEPVIPIVL